MATRSTGICRYSLLRPREFTGLLKMKIAILGWGSLLWEPGAEFEKWIELPWKNDGPKLAIEFSRISNSRNGALTLVIDDVNGTPTNVAWCLSKRDRLEDAISDLQSREGTTAANIASVSVADKPADPASLQNEIILWATKKKFDAVIWTALKSNFEGEAGKPFSVEEALAHLKGLDDIGKARAAEYVRNAPRFVKTKLRSALASDPNFTPPPTPYSALKPKTKRVIENDLGTLFSPRALLPSDIEKIKALGKLVLFRELKYKGRSVFLSDDGAAAIRRLTSSIFEMPALADIISEAEVAAEVKNQYNEWLEKDLQPDGQEFADPVAEALLSKVKDYQFLIKLEGLDLRDQDGLELGPVRIQKPDKAVLDTVKFGGLLDKEQVSGQFEGALWLIGKSRGSPAIALERFELQVTLTVGILAVCGAILYEGAIWRSRVQPMLYPVEDKKWASLLRWEAGGDKTSLSRRGGGTQDLPLDANGTKYLTEECFLRQMASLVGMWDRTELQDAIVRALYWMADAYSDRNPMMKFVKLWSCIECFFALTKEKITEANAKGIASILVFGGYKVIEPSQYGDTKRRVEELYDLRSLALHRAQFGHVETADLNQLSSWVAWIIVTMVSLSQRGYKTLEQVKEQVLRLDNLSDRPSV